MNSLQRKTRGLKSLVLLILLIACVAVKCDRETMMKMQKESEQVDRLIKEQIEREQQIRKRQGVETLGNYDRNLLKAENVNSIDVADELRYLSEELASHNVKSNEDKLSMEAEKLKSIENNRYQMITETDPIKLLEQLQLKDVVGTKNICRKASKTYNPDEATTANRKLESSEDVLKQLQSEIKASKASSMKSNRDTLIESLNKAHTLCLFGATTSIKSKSIMTFDQICRYPKSIGNLSLSNLKFTSQIASVQVDFLKRYHEIPQPHSIICGVSDIHISHSSTMSLTQYLPHVCFDRLNNPADFDQTVSTKQPVANNSDNYPNMRHDL